MEIWRKRLEIREKFENLEKIRKSGEKIANSETSSDLEKKFGNVKTIRK